MTALLVLVQVWLPTKAAEYLVMCVQCGDLPSRTACEDCGESFCAPCHDLLHLKARTLQPT